MTFRREIDQRIEQLRALFDAGRIVVRSVRGGFSLADEIVREVGEIDRRVSEHLAETARRHRDAQAAATYYGEGSALPDEVAALEAIGARHRAGHARNEATRFLAWDPAPGGDQTVRIGYEIATVHLEDDGLLERDDRRFAYECTRCGRLWDEHEIVQARDLASIGIGRRAFYIDRPDGGHVGFATGQLRRTPRQRDASGRFTVSVPARDTIENRDAFDALIAAGRGWGMSQTQREEIMRAVRRPAEVAPEHAKKLGEPSPKLPIYRPT